MNGSSVMIADAAPVTLLPDIQTSLDLDPFRCCPVIATLDEITGTIASAITADTTIPIIAAKDSFIIIHFLWVIYTHRYISFIQPE